MSKYIESSSVESVVQPAPETVHFSPWLINLRDALSAVRASNIEPKRKDQEKDNRTPTLAIPKAVA